MGALYLGVLVYEVLSRIQSSPGELMPGLDSTACWILMMTGVISVVSFIDDRQGLPVTVRFGIQLLAASLLVIGSGLVFPLTTVPLPGFIKFGWIAVPFTVVFLVWMANLYNFMDGMDGFAGGMTVIG
ncbi:MAG: UDP-phosphate N-acetylglucosaminyl 1-phosphate transferase, partial [Nitrospirota bacterium]